MGAEVGWGWGRPLSDPPPTVTAMRSDLPVPVLRPAHEPVGDLHIDCGTCEVRGDACGDCVVTVLLGHPETVSGETRVALAVLADSGLVPPLRLVRPDEGAA